MNLTGLSQLGVAGIGLPSPNDTLNQFSGRSPLRTFSGNSELLSLDEVFSFDLNHLRSAKNPLDQLLEGLRELVELPKGVFQSNSEFLGNNIDSYKLLSISELMATGSTLTENTKSLSLLTRPIERIFEKTLDKFGEIIDKVGNSADGLVSDRLQLSELGHVQNRETVQPQTLPPSPQLQQNQTAQTKTARNNPQLETRYVPYEREKNKKQQRKNSKNQSPLNRSLLKMYDALKRLLSHITN
jgi:hypothetical protein